MKENKRYNDKGKLITGRIQFKDPSYGTVNADGSLSVNWQLVDSLPNFENGFDTTHKEPNGNYSMEIELSKGTEIIRYGSERGAHFTAPRGTDYEALSLPYIRDSIEFHKYKVIADGIKVVCIVERGIAAAAFGSKGRGVQYYHKKRITECIEKKELARISK